MADTVETKEEEPSESCSSGVPKQPKNKGEELARCEAVMAADPGWIRFSLAAAPWVPFTVDSTIQNAWDAQQWELQGTAEDRERWMHKMEETIVCWIIRRIIEKDNRSHLFRALGRGWIWIFVVRKKRQFRWWFESLSLIMETRQQELSAMGLIEDRKILNNYTEGYNCHCEVVFVFKGLIPTPCPQIRIMKIEKIGEEKYKWGSNDDVQRARSTTLSTDEQRSAHAKRSRQRKAYRKRVQDRQAAETSAAAVDEEQSGEDQEDEEAAKVRSEFDRLLAEMKGDDKRNY